MSDPYFEVLDEADDGGRYLSGTATAGPWDPGLQHGGPPSALQARAAERLANFATGREDLFACRIAVDFLRPVPVAEVQVSASVLRAGRNAVVVGTTLSGPDGRQCLTGRIWLLARSDTTAVATPAEAQSPPDRTPAFSLSFPFSDSVDWHEVEGSIIVPGPAVVWARPRPPLVAGERLSSLQRAAMVADSGNGISAVLNWREWTFLNVDLDVHLARPLVGEWLHLSASTQVGPNGTALARSTIGDVAGAAGAGAQMLLLARRGAAD